MSDTADRSDYCRTSPKFPRADGLARGDIIITDPGWRRHVPHLERLIIRALTLAGRFPTIVLTDDRTVKRLNARDRGRFKAGRNKPTNVLTYEQPPEIILALGTILREARLSNKRPAHHLAHLIIHGALHLAGADHHQAGDATRMERRETRLLARLRVPNPWKHRA